MQTQMREGRRPRDGGGRDGRDTCTGRGAEGGWSPGELEERGRTPPEPSERARSCPHRDSDLWPPECERTRSCGFEPRSEVEVAVSSGGLQVTHSLSPRLGGASPRAGRAPICPRQHCPLDEAECATRLARSERFHTGDT
ncbi:uncharacterized protein LOC124251849 isoform X4 [Equus quagga]|uniref:uncharacterized protein LOC124251849 isoform X4 n=1 Tax=Equus quagga TaxID=89248 RepID=UPI001EE31FD0|nr:uncharacterized protein LOC124251849 isoform X4 [Equus quagga]